MTTSAPFSLPAKTPPRSRTINIRLTEQEYQQVSRLASDQTVSVSELGRHFIMQAVTYYRQQHPSGKDWQG